MKIIDRWPNTTFHLRNIEISLSVAKGNNYREVSKYYNIVSGRISQIYRILMAYLCEQKFDVPYLEAVYDKRWYKHPDAVSMITEYLHFYINEKKWTNTKEISEFIFYS